MDGELVALLDDLARLVDPGQVEPGVYALREEVERDRDEVDVAGALAVPEQRALDPLRARHQPELGGRDGGAAVVVGMDGEDRRVAPREVPPEPLDAVGVDVRRELLDRRRQVHDHLLVGGRPPLLGHGLADLERVVELRVVEALGRVLEDDLAGSIGGELAAQPCPAHGQVGDPVAVETEDDAALRDRRRVVEMDDRALRTRDRLERPLDELRPGLREDCDGRVVRDELVLDEEPGEVEVGLRGRRESDLDLADPQRDQEVEEAALARRVHGVDERLVPVAEIRGAPDRRAVEDTVGPRAIGQIDGRVRTVLPVRHGHGTVLLLESGRRRTTGAGGLVYVDASLPLAGKDGEQDGQAAERCHEDGPAHARTITHFAQTRNPRARIAGARKAKTLARRSPVRCPVRGGATRLACGLDVARAHEALHLRLCRAHLCALVGVPPPPPPASYRIEADPSNSSGRSDARTQYDTHHRRLPRTRRRP